ncbi:maleylpyruvate isomerase family mycothiol-dependent enzyme [Nakamurella lactea]|uniref:maleylpyruvate isomerase family mycothiol-dependent enzyme n=1 Tax=Nakamurella lactea TaxID=459515 RepID=UPI0004280F51|nr:maleylpyruvate isomerase family mycothiol-dependent enzyme [Nakamurella lactea]
MQAADPYVALAGAIDDFVAQCSDLEAVLNRCPDLSADSAAIDWTVADTITHLWHTNDEAALAVKDPAKFAAWAEVARGNTALREEQRRRGRKLGRGVVDEWLRSVTVFESGARQSDPETRVGWYGPPMRLVRLVGARVMEHWAHGMDIVDALGGRLPQTDRLYHVAELGFITRRWSYQVRDLTPPDDDVRVELDPPAGGGRWSFGPELAAERITGSAVDFCLVVTQRRHLLDTTLTTTPGAEEWLRVAQCYAGAPGIGRPPRVSAPGPENCTERRNTT